MLGDCQMERVAAAQAELMLSGKAGGAPKIFSSDLNLHEGLAGQSVQLTAGCVGVRTA